MDQSQEREIIAPDPDQPVSDDDQEFSTMELRNTDEGAVDAQEFGVEEDQVFTTQTLTTADDGTRVDAADDGLSAVALAGIILAAVIIVVLIAVLVKKRR